MSIQTVETLVLNLDPSIPLAEQIRRGNYTYVNSVITPNNFHLMVPAGKRDIILYDPRGYVSSEEMVRWMKGDGCVPATLDDALAMGQQYPDRQRRNPIVFLGTIWPVAFGIRHVSVLYGRSLELSWFDNTWNMLCRFAAVRYEK